MRNIPSGLAAHLAGEATTLCHCWKLIRRDGTVFGFTDHDRDIAFAGMTFIAGTGLDAADITTESGFAIGGGEVSGALMAASLTETDLSGGLYDDASVEMWLVNWADTDQRLLLDVMSIGEIKRTDRAFVAELRSLAHRLDEERGRVYRPACSADVGDGRCKVDLTSSAFRGVGTVAALEGTAGFLASGIGSYADDWFTNGRLVWTGGRNAGQVQDIKLHIQNGVDVIVMLWVSPAEAIAPGDSFTLTAGCDKALATCRDKFNNLMNFRGFPHMPGNDVILRLPQQGEPGLDGGSLFR